MKPTKLFTAEHSVVVYSHSPDFGVSVEKICEPEYWAHVAAQLRPGHRIEVLAADGSWWAMLIVRSASRTEAVVQPLQVVKLGKTEQTAKSDDAAYEVSWGGPAQKHRVVRLSDKTVVSKDHDSKESADQWLKNHLISLSR